MHRPGCLSTNRRRSSTRPPLTVVPVLTAHERGGRRNPPDCVCAPPVPGDDIHEGHDPGSIFENSGATDRSRGVAEHAERIRFESPRLRVIPIRIQSRIRNHRQHEISRMGEPIRKLISGISVISGPIFSSLCDYEDLRGSFQPRESAESGVLGGAPPKSLHSNPFSTPPSPARSQPVEKRAVEPILSDATAEAVATEPCRCDPPAIGVAEGTETGSDFGESKSREPKGPGQKRPSPRAYPTAGIASPVVHPLSGRRCMRSGSFGKTIPNQRPGKRSQSEERQGVRSPT